MQKPPELGAFRWIIDGKDKQKTAYEAAWELMEPASSRPKVSKTRASLSKKVTTLFSGGVS